VSTVIPLRRSGPPMKALSRAIAAAMTGLALTLGAGSAVRADGTPPRPDTSQWKCAQCPFFQGYTTNAAAGVEYAHGADAYYGRYTGVDHTGAYADASASGQWRDASGHYGQYELENLGLASRDATIEVGKEGGYDLKVGYDGQPVEIYDNTATPYRSSASGAVLTLPSNWIYSGSTAGMLQLTPGLSPVDIESNRRTVALAGQLFAGTQWTLYTDLSHEEQKGTGLTGASFLTDAVQLPQPIDYATNTIETGAVWSSPIASVHVAYTGSWFQDNIDALTFENPYLPLIAGENLGRLALPPSNNLQQGAISGEIALPIFQSTTLSYSASFGRLTQDAGFLPDSTLPGATVPAPGALGGDVRLSHYALSLSSRPLSRLYVRGSARYDGRDDHTPVLTLPQIVTDELAGGTATTPLYSEDRSHLEGSADYRLWSWIKAGVAGDYLNTHFGPGQVVTYTQDSRAWGHVTVTPVSTLSFDLKGGSARRDASSFFDIAALPPGENPLLRAFEYAPRDEEFYSANGTWSLGASLSLSVEGRWTDDYYRLSELGLRNGHSRELTSTLAWTPTTTLSLYVNGAYQRLSALQYGSIGEPGAAPWQVLDGQYFWNLGAGGRWTVSERWDLQIDYTHAITRENDNIEAGGAASTFPQNDSNLNSLLLKASYHLSRALSVRLHYVYSSYASNDWALDGVTFDTVPNLLTLGEQPYRFHVNLVGLSVLYRFDDVKPPPAGL
jgi:MtrB/PioB family decaheme-associated outer membrane protein